MEEAVRYVDRKLAAGVSGMIFYMPLGSGVGF